MGVTSEARGQGKSHAVAIGVRAVSLAAALVTAAACAGREAAAIEPVGTVQQIMHVLDPSADAIWASVSTDVTADGVTEVAPATEEEWVALETHAVAIAEAGNLLMLPGRAVDAGEWLLRARELREAGRAALAAARSRNPDEMLRIGEIVTISCDNCHKTYWTPDSVLLH